MGHSVAATACLGLSLVAAGGCGDEIDRRPATWGYISPAIMQPSCATVSCHGRAAAAAGLDLSDPDRGYKSLTGLSVSIPDPDPAKPAIRELRPLVVPYNPDQSRVVHMLRASNAARMPPDRPLSEADIALIERWILNGAKKIPDSTRPPALDASSDVRGDASADASADATSLDVASGG